MSRQGRRTKPPMWNSRKAWALVLGGMLVIGIANVMVGFCSLPEGFDENWRWADAGDDGGAAAQTVPPADAAPAALPDAAPPDAQSK